MAQRLSHLLAVEIHTATAHPDEFTGGDSILSVCARAGLTHQPQHRRALRELITYCLATDPAWRPTPHIQRALRPPTPPPPQHPPRPVPPRRAFDLTHDGSRRARRPIRPGTRWGT